MKVKETKQLLLANLEAAPRSYGSIILNKEKTTNLFEECLSEENIEILRRKIYGMRTAIHSYKNDKEGFLNIDSNGDTVSLRRDVFISELDQILETKTIERAKYYISRLKTGIEKVRTNKINDINLHRWKEYDYVEIY